MNCMQQLICNEINFNSVKMTVNLHYMSYYFDLFIWKKSETYN